MIEKKLKNLNLPEKVKIVEKPGQKFIQVMKKYARKERKVPCEDPECLIGNTEKGGDCRKNEIVYAIHCKECKDQYIGETCRNGRTRSIEHVEDSQSNNVEKREKSILLRHMSEKHSGQKVDFDMKIVRSYQHDALSRQCAEAVFIKNVNPEKRINNKTEYNQPEM